MTHDFQLAALHFTTRQIPSGLPVIDGRRDPVIDGRRGPVTDGRRGRSDSSSAAELNALNAAHLSTFNVALAEVEERNPFAKVMHQSDLGLDQLTNWMTMPLTGIHLGKHLPLLPCSAFPGTGRSTYSNWKRQRIGTSNDEHI